MAKTLIIAEPSEMLRKGLVQIIEEMGSFSNVKEVSCASALLQSVKRYNPHLLIVNPLIMSSGILSEIKEAGGDSLRLAALVYALFDEEQMEAYDVVILVNDNRQKIHKKLQSLLENYKDKESGRPEESLSQRELDVLKLLVKGLSNKEISEKLFISTHTVISHRKNITQKLNIKSVAGLTVYALLNEIVSMEEVQ